MKYEYKVVPINVFTLESLLNEHGDAGWRLVETLQSMGYTTRVIFEREKDVEDHSE